MRTLLARLVLVIAAVPAMDVDADVEALVIDDQISGSTVALERRLERQLKQCVLPYLHVGDPHGDLVVNVCIDASGSVRVVNTHGGNAAMRDAVIARLDGSKV